VLFTKYYQNDQFKEVEMGRVCSTNEEKKNACRILVEKPEGNRPLGRLKRRWMDNINMDLGEIGWDGMDWIHLAQDRDQWRALVNTVNELSGSIQCLKFLEYLHNWRLLKKGSAL
jgi:hypothetical protein